MIDTIKIHVLDIFVHDVYYKFLELICKLPLGRLRLHVNLQRKENGVRKREM